MLDRALRAGMHCICPDGQPRRSGKAVVWEPPLLIGPTEELPKGSVPKDMVTRLRISDLTVVLDETKLTAVAAHFGNTIEHRGDAATSLGWVCFQGSTGQGRRWVLWLMSSEINGPAIGGFQWRLVPPLAQVDRRCRILPAAKGRIELPIPIRVGMTERELLRVLGQPTRTRKERLLYSHEKELSNQNESYKEINLLAVLPRDGTVWAIEVWKSAIS